MQFKNYAWGLGTHLFWSCCNCSFGAFSLALSLSPSLSLCLSPLLFGPLHPSPPCLPSLHGSLWLISTCLFWEFSLTLIQTHTTEQVSTFGLCAICYYTALLILFTHNSLVIYFLDWCKQIVIFSVLAVILPFFINPGSSTPSMSSCIYTTTHRDRLLTTALSFPFLFYPCPQRVT